MRRVGDYTKYFPALQENSIEEMLRGVAKPGIGPAVKHTNVIPGQWRGNCHENTQSKKGQQKVLYIIASQGPQSKPKHYIAYDRDNMCLVSVVMKDIGRCHLTWYTNNLVPTS